MPAVRRTTDGEVGQCVYKAKNTGLLSAMCHWKQAGLDSLQSGHLGPSLCVVPQNGDRLATGHQLTETSHMNLCLHTTHYHTWAWQLLQDQER